MRFLVDECCARRLVEHLREGGHDVRYAAESDRQSSDIELLNIAQEEDRIVVTEDFDFGVLAVRDGLSAPGILILHLPGWTPSQRSERLADVLASENFELTGRLTIVEKRRTRQRMIT